MRSSPEPEYNGASVAAAASIPRPAAPSSLTRPPPPGETLECMAAETMTSLEFVQQLSMGNERGRARDREREREMLGCSLWDGWLFQARAPAVAGAVPCQVRAASVAVEGGVAMTG